MITEELSKNKLAELDEMLEEYQSVDREIARREFEIRYPWRPTDANVGGGRSSMNADGQERLLEKIQEDPRIIYLHWLKDAGDAAVSKLTEDQHEVYIIRYCSPTRVMWPDVADVAHKSRSGVYKCRYAILECLAKELGILT